MEFYQLTCGFALTRISSSFDGVGAVLKKKIITATQTNRLRPHPPHAEIYDTSMIKCWAKKLGGGGACLFAGQAVCTA